MKLFLKKYFFLAILFLGSHDDLFSKIESPEKEAIEQAEIYLDNYIESQIEVIAILVRAFYNEKINHINKYQSKKNDFEVLSSKDKKSLFQIYKSAEQNGYLLNTILFERIDYQNFFSKHGLYGNNENYRYILDSVNFSKQAPQEFCLQTPPAPVALKTNLCHEFIKMNSKLEIIQEKSLNLFPSVMTVNNEKIRSELIERIVLLQQLKSEDYKGALAYFLPKLNKDPKAKGFYLKIQQTFAKRQQGSGQVGLLGL